MNDLAHRYAELVNEIRALNGLRPFTPLPLGSDEDYRSAIAGMEATLAKAVKP